MSNVHVQHQASSVKHYETITVSFWRCSWAKLLAMCTRADRIEIPNKWTNHDKLVQIHTAWRKLVSRKTGHSKRAVWRKTMQDPHFHFRIPWLLRLQEPQEGKPEPSCFQRCCWLNTGSRIVLGFCFSVLKFFSPFCPFSLLLAALWTWKLPFPQYFQHFWARTFHFTWNLQHFGAGCCYFKGICTFLNSNLSFSMRCATFWCSTCSFTVGFKLF